MSRFVDTPDYWVRQEVDDILLDMEASEAATLADEFERTRANYDGDQDMATAIVAELRRRADAGIRFWPGPQLVPVADMIDDEIPW